MLSKQGFLPLTPAESLNIITHLNCVVNGFSGISQAISIQLAGSYIGSILMPPAFGLVAAKFTVHLWPISLSIFVGLLLLCVCLLDYVTHKKLNKSYARERVFDILHTVSMETLKRERRIQRRLRNRQKKR